MPIAFPDPVEQPEETAQEALGSASRRPDERERTRPRTRARTREATESPAAAGGPTSTPTVTPAAEAHGEADRVSGGEVVPFPSSGQVVPAAESALVDAARQWIAEAKETAVRAVDGSVWRARPPALRDSHTRLQRAEWAGGVPLLMWLGWIYGYPALGIRALLMALAWLLDHPSRLLVASAIATIALYLD